MRNLFVVDVERPVSSSLRTLTVQFHICPVRSMIDPRLHRKRISSYYPLCPRDLPSLSAALRLYHHTQRLRFQIQRNFSCFQTLNYFEYVLYCRVEFSRRYEFANSIETCSKESDITQSLERLKL